MSNTASDLKVGGTRVQHNVFFAWKDSMSTEQLETTLQMLRNLKDVCEGVLTLTLGPQNSPEKEVLFGKQNVPFQYGLSVQFESVAARDAYLVHPKHVEAVDYFKPHILDVVVTDYLY